MSLLIVQNLRIFLEGFVRWCFLMLLLNARSSFVRLFLIHEVVPVRGLLFTGLSSVWWIHVSLLMRWFFMCLKAVPRWLYITCLPWRAPEFLMSERQTRDANVLWSRYLYIVFHKVDLYSFMLIEADLSYVWRGGSLCDTLSWEPDPCDLMSPPPLLHPWMSLCSRDDDLEAFIATTHSSPLT